MNKIFEIPEIIFPTGDSVDLTDQCDCACDCACSLPTALESSRIHIDPNLHYQARFQKIGIKNGYSICHGIQNSPLVLNQSAYTIASFFKQPHCVKSIPDDLTRNLGTETIRKTLKQMIAFGLLVPHNRTIPKPVEAVKTLSVWFSPLKVLHCGTQYLENNLCHIVVLLPLTFHITSLDTLLMTTQESNEQIVLAFSLAFLTLTLTV